jgi:hypothetical protein
MATPHMKMANRRMPPEKNITGAYPGAIHISLVREPKGGNAECPGGEAGGGLERARWLPAQARLLAPAHGTENCKQSSCCCAVFR